MKCRAGDRGLPQLYLLSPSPHGYLLCVQLSPTMERTARSFLQLLRILVSFFRKRWDQSTRRLWCVFAFLCSRFSPRRPKEDETRRRIEARSAMPSRSTVTCASQFPLTSTPIAGEDTTIVASPEAISIQVRRPTIRDTGDTLYQSRENRSTGHLDIDSCILEESGPISRTPGFAGRRDEPEPTHVFPPTNREELTGPNSRPSSQFSHRPVSQYTGHSSVDPPGSQNTHPSPSEYSHRSLSNLDGAEAAARGYLPATPSPWASSSALSARPQSAADPGISYVYRAPSPATRVRRSSPLRNVSRSVSKHRTRPSTPVSACHSVAASLGPSTAPPPKGRLRPMIRINRYEKHKEVVIQDVDNSHVFSPVTTEFVR